MKTFLSGIVILVFVLAIVGWFKTVYNLTQCDFSSPYRCEVINGAGTFLLPLGAIVGWIGVEDDNE